jgi:hypothetical protein
VNVICASAISLTLAIWAQPAIAGPNDPPPPSKGDQAADALKTTNSATGLLVTVTGVAGAPTAEALEQIGKAGDVSGAIGLGFTAGQMASNIYRKDVPALVDQSQELMLDAAAASACLGTGPGVVACGASWELGKLAGKSINWAVKQTTGKEPWEHAYDAVERFSNEADSWMGQSVGRNAMQPVAKTPKSTVENFTVQVEQEQAAAGAAASASGCHPGHDEAAHPNGCHSPR